MNRFLMALSLGTILLASQSRAGDEASGRSAPERIRESGAQRIEALNKMLAIEKSNLDEAASRLAGNAELVAAADACRNALAALSEHAKTAAEAVQAGATEKVAQLEAAGKVLHGEFSKTRNALALLRIAADARKLSETLPPAADAEAADAREKYAVALRAVASFYAEQSKAPSSERGGIPSEAQETESRLKAQRERSRIEYDHRQAVASMKMRMEKAAADPALQPKVSVLMEKAAALRDAQLKLLDAQDAVLQAHAEKRQAEQALAEAAGQRRHEAKAREGEAAPAAR